MAAFNNNERSLFQRAFDKTQEAEKRQRQRDKETRRQDSGSSTSSARKLVENIFHGRSDKTSGSSHSPHFNPNTYFRNRDVPNAYSNDLNYLSNSRPSSSFRGNDDKIYHPNEEIPGSYHQAAQRLNVHPPTVSDEEWQRYLTERPVWEEEKAMEMERNLLKHGTASLEDVPASREQKHSFKAITTHAHHDLKTWQENLDRERNELKPNLVWHSLKNKLKHRSELGFHLDRKETVLFQECVEGEVNQVLQLDDLLQVFPIKEEDVDDLTKYHIFLKSFEEILSLATNFGSRHEFCDGRWFFNDQGGDVDSQVLLKIYQLFQNNKELLEGELERLWVANRLMNLLFVDVTEFWAVFTALEPFIGVFWKYICPYGRIHGSFTIQRLAIDAKDCLVAVMNNLNPNNLPAAGHAWTKANQALNKLRAGLQPLLGPHGLHTSKESQVLPVLPLSRLQYSECSDAFLVLTAAHDKLAKIFTSNRLDGIEGDTQLEAAYNNLRTYNLFADADKLKELRSRYYDDLPPQHPIPRLVDNMWSVFNEDPYVRQLGHTFGYSDNTKKEWGTMVASGLFENEECRMGLIHMFKDCLYPQRNDWRGLLGGIKPVRYGLDFSAPLRKAAVDTVISIRSVTSREFSTRFDWQLYQDQLQQIEHKINSKQWKQWKEQRGKWTADTELPWDVRTIRQQFPQFSPKGIQQSKTPTAEDFQHLHNEEQAAYKEKLQAALAAVKSFLYVAEQDCSREECSPKQKEWFTNNSGSLRRCFTAVQGFFVEEFPSKGAQGRDTRLNLHPIILNYKLWKETRGHTMSLICLRYPDEDLLTDSSAKSTKEAQQDKETYESRKKMYDSTLHAAEVFWNDHYKKDFDSYRTGRRHESSKFGTGSR
ncbi:hypothetical protein T439DRAFT_354903 [Meredithblackwellia eburnea MCA 4105]